MPAKKSIKTEDVVLKICGGQIFKVCTYFILYKEWPQLILQEIKVSFYCKKSNFSNNKFPPFLSWSTLLWNFFA
jgi:hypothetical protein